jgi:hypothetical protein
MRTPLSGRCLAMVVLGMQIALFAYVNVALEQCEQPSDAAPDWSAAEHTIAELRRELERERELRVALQAQLEPTATEAKEQRQRHRPAPEAATSPQLAAGEDGGDGDGGGEFEPAVNVPDPAVEAGDGSSALVFDDGTQRGSGGGSHPMHRFHRPLLVRFTNYNATSPVRNPYGGEAARRWFQRHGYVETDSNDWDVLWCGKGQYLNFAAQSLDLPRPWQSHNHCLGAGLLAGNKHSFVTHHNLMARRFPQDYTHVPETFDLPIEHAALLARMKQQPDEMWIFKPSTGARGEGIRLVWEGSQVPRTGRNTVQRYIEKPYLIEGRKVHLRLYVVLRDVEPLKVFVFKDGLALFASEVYSDDESERENVQVHLTNAAMMKHATDDHARDAA